MVQGALCLLCKAVAVVTSLFWLVIWLALLPVEDDIRDNINEFLMRNLKLEEEFDFFSLLLVVHFTLMLTLLIVLVLQKNCSAVHSNYLANAVTVLVSIYNIAMMAFLFISGGDVVSLVLFSLPITGTLFLSKVWMVLVFVPLLLAVVLSSHCLSSIKCLSSFKCLSALRRLSTLFKGALVVVLQVAIAVVTIVTFQIGCQPCMPTLPPKPTFAAHRGLVETHVENSVVGFQAAGEIDSVAVLESDVQLSVDGEQFLIHDRTLVRTTTIKDSCPEEDLFVDPSSLNYHGPPCPLGSITLKGDESQTIPTFSQLLQIAVESGKFVMYDLYEPTEDHPWHSQYINVTLDAIVKSGIDQRKVYWLEDNERLWVHNNYPDLQQLAKTKDVSFDEFSELGITAVNERWTTPLETIRESQSRNLTVFVFIINSPSLYEYFWCAGVDSVTTDNVLTLDQHNKNSLHEFCTDGFGSRDWVVVASNGILLVLSLFIISCQKRDSEN